VTNARLLRGSARGLEALAHALRSGEPGAGGALRPAPRDEAGWEAEARGVSRAHVLPAEAWAALADRQAALGAPAESVDAARRLGHPDTLAIVTGQQPGLLGGPLLSLHKAAGAVALARRLGATLGRAVVPVFWLASEDHDVEEANQATLLDAAGQPRAVAAALAPDRRSLADVPLPADAVAALLASVRAVLPATARGEEALALLAPRAGETLVEAFARGLFALLGRAGLVVLEVRTLAPWLGESLAAIVRDGPAVTAAVRASGPPLRAAGHVAPLEPRADDLPLFVRAAPGAARQRLGVDGEGHTLRDGRSWGGGLAEVAAALAAQPLLASPDVVGRVLLQNAALPVLAYVAGPTELAYHAQIAPAAATTRRRFPLVLPRPSATWVDARALGTAEAFGVTIDAVVAGEGPPRRDEAPPAAHDAPLRALEADLARRRAEAAASTGGMLPPPLERAFTRVADALARERATLEAALDEQAGVARGRWVRLENLMRPRGRPQERSLSLLTLLARYGRDAVGAALGALDPLADGHWLLVADGEAPSVPASPAPKGLST
jgi:bacillithiol synthase